MAWVIYRPLVDRWLPSIVGLPREGPGVHSVLTSTVPLALQERRFSYRGDRFEPHEVRTEFWLHSAHKDFGDVFPVCAMWGCTTEWRREVEALEPGVHQFFPISIRRPRSKRPIFRLDGREAGPDDFHLFNCLQQIDAVIPERSSGSVERLKYGLLSFNVRDDDLCVAREAVTGRHLWQDSRKAGAREHFFISDALMEAFRRAGLTGFKARPVREELGAAATCENRLDVES